MERKKCFNCGRKRDVKFLTETGKKIVIFRAFKCDDDPNCRIIRQKRLKK
jgi:hypothetical protein